MPAETHALGAKWLLYLTTMKTGVGRVLLDAVEQGHLISESQACTWPHSRRWDPLVSGKQTSSGLPLIVHYASAEMSRPILYAATRSPLGAFQSHSVLLSLCSSQSDEVSLLLPRLECNGTISADCNLLLLDSSHPLASVCRIAGITAGSTMKDTRVQEETGHHVTQVFLSYTLVSPRPSA
uniref:putative uncharacterized protein encoded by LINC00269 isoform X3 n=1 Tax=Callithrix jacchus TaxID=9483 RepID=UPI0023DD0A58|nr:putative uncharacterized protein encoded by LINC00269 isoform X3 [Callithrix jacchus]